MSNIQISELEQKILKYWQDKKIFEKTLRPSRGRRAKDYSFYDGPPFATGQPHYGHILASVIKDAIPRYQTMKGRRVKRVWGWDCHGLPVENIVEEQLGIKTKKDIEKFGIQKFNEIAREKVLEYVDDWKKFIPRIGRWVDMENAYKTMDWTYTESIWWVFKTLYDKGLIYEGYKSMHICPRCETTLSNFEVAQGYKEIEDSSIIVKFEPLSQENHNLEPKTYLLAWTTTPWTLPGNAALAVNPEAIYAKIKVPVFTDDRGLTDALRKIADKGTILEGIEPVKYKFNGYVYYILAKNRLAEIEGDYQIEKEFRGRELVGAKYNPLFNYYRHKSALNPRESASVKNGWKIYPADFVKTDEGTGIVHIAPAFGADDMELGKKYDLPFIQHVGMDGKFKKEVSDFAGLPVKPKDNHQLTDKKIIAWLAKNNKLLKNEIIIHSYPHCWRCDTPLLNYAASSWFVKVSAMKKGEAGLIENNQKINWVPAHIKEGRFGRGLEEAPDWAISRARYWGAPLPIWRCQTGRIKSSKLKAQNSCGKRIVIGSIEELKRYFKKSGNNYFLMRHGEYTGLLKNITSSSLKTAKKYPLTLKGIEEIKKRAAGLKRKNIQLIFASDLFRTKETAKILAVELGLSKKQIILDKRLREVDMGIFDGKNADYYDNYAPILQKFHQAPPQGENLTAVKNRTMDFLYEIDAKYKNKNILIVSHEYTLWLMLAGAMGLTPEEAVKLKEERESRGKDREIVRTAEVVEMKFTRLPHNQNFELDLHRPYIDEVEFRCDCGGKMKRVPYVFDCWFESGSMPYASIHFPFAQKAAARVAVAEMRREKIGPPQGFPAEFIAEGLDQTRGWFYTLHVLATGLFGKPAFKNVIVNGIILAENGEKMSKRLKNYPDPSDIVNRYGADALRLYLLGAPVVKAEDLNFSEKSVDEIYKKVILRLLNVYNFYELYAANAGANPRNHQRKSASILDKWILARLNSLTAEVTKAMDAYELDRAVRPIVEFIDDLSTWYLRRSRERFKTNTNKNREGIANARYVLIELAKIMAPFAPFLTEWLYLQINQKSKAKDQKHNSRLKNGESVHLEFWPKRAKLTASDRKIINDMREVRRVASLGLQARSIKGIKVRQPLPSIKINRNSVISGNKELLKLLKDEINVKKVLFDKNNSLGDGVWLDTTITPELKKEGIVREYLRLIQDLRQEAALKPRDHIIIYLEASKEIQNSIEDRIKEFKYRLGAKSVEFRRAEKLDIEIEKEIDSQKIWAGIKKVK